MRPPPKQEIAREVAAREEVKAALAAAEVARTQDGTAVQRNVACVARS